MDSGCQTQGDVGRIFTLEAQSAGNNDVLLRNPESPDKKGPVLHRAQTGEPKPGKTQEARTGDAQADGPRPGKTRPGRSAQGVESEYVGIAVRLYADWSRSAATDRMAFA